MSFWKLKWTAVTSDQRKRHIGFGRPQGWTFLHVIASEIILRLLPAHCFSRTLLGVGREVFVSEFLPSCTLCSHALIPSSSGCPIEYSSAFHFSGWVAVVLVRHVNGLSTGAHRWPLWCEGLKIVGLM